MKNKLKEFREKIGLKQSVLAKKLSYSKQAICNIEKCKRKLSYETALQIENLYGVSAEYLMGRDVPINRAKDTLTEEECKFFCQLEKLSADERSYIFDITEELSKNK